jgi:hypothetical protein
VDALPKISGETRIHLNKRIFPYYKNTFGEGEYSVEWWTDFTHIPGVPQNPKTGLVFTTTTHAAVWRAYMLGYDPIYILGFDCTKGYLHDNPHWYGVQGKYAEYHPGWDIEMAAIIKELNTKGIEVLNLSSPTTATATPKGVLEDVLERFM